MSLSATNSIKNVKLKKAITGLIFNQSFFSSILLQQKIIEDNKYPTCSVDGKHLRYNNEFINGLDHESIQGVLTHEIMHLILLHHARMGKREHKLANYAMDYSINHQLVKSGLKLPKGFLDEARFHNMNFEDIYKILADEQQKQQEEKDKQKQEKKEKQQGPMEEDSGDNQGDNSGEPSESEGDGDSEKSDKSEKGDKEDLTPAKDNSEDESESDEEAPANSNDSSKESDDDREGDNGKSDEESNEDDADEPTFGEVEPAVNPEIAEEEMKIMVKQALAISKACGQSPNGELIKIIEEAMEPRYNWREVLSQFISEITQKDYSFSRPNKRHLHNGIILPTLYSKNCGRIVMVIDTSGSLIGDVAILANEVVNCFETMVEDNQRAKISIIYCDCQINGVQEFEGGDEIKLTPSGGGGTMMGPAFKYIDDNFSDEKIECLFLLTDGDIFDMDAINKLTPEYPVLFGLTRMNNYFKPAFGEVFKLLNI